MRERALATSYLHPCNHVVVVDRFVVVVVDGSSGQVVAVVGYCVLVAVVEV